MADEGAQFGAWTVRGTLGAGGMGVVYDATDAAGRRAALKVIAEGFAVDDTFRARFRREVEIGQRVSGLHVASLLDADADAARPWIAIEHVAGPTLEEAIRTGGPLPEPAARAFAEATLDALADIHAAGVVHRDFKPSNVIMTVQRPIVIDFGISAAEGVTSLTQTGASMGSAGWMSPEQIKGEEITTATDVFSWGAVLAFASSGVPPFGTGRFETLTYKIINEPPQLDGVHASLRPAVEAALEKDPARRASVDDLRAIVGGTTRATPPPPLVTPPPPPPAPARPSAPTPTGLDSPPPTAVGAGATPVKRSPRRRWGLPVAMGAVAAVFVGIVLVATRSGGDGAVAAETTTTGDVESTATSLPPGSSTTAESIPPVGAASLEADLFCRDLDARSYSFRAAAAYWMLWGTPERMDADGDGIPCETVYPASDIQAFFGNVWTLDDGLFCRDIDSEGFTFEDSVAYWMLQGMPERMDADVDGIPCETIYPSADRIDFFNAL